MIYVPPNPRPRWTFGDVVGAAAGGAILTALFALVIFGLFLGVG